MESISATRGGLRGESADRDASRSILKFTVELMKTGSFYNGAAYLDTLNPEATAKFIEVTHERYARQCGDRLGARSRESSPMNRTGEC